MFDHWLLRQADKQGQRRVKRGLAAAHAAMVRGLAWRLKLLNRALQTGDAHSVALQRKELEDFLQAINATYAFFPEVQAALEEEPANSEMVQTAFDAPLPAELGPRGDAEIYWVSSATLAEAHAYLTQHTPGAAAEPEWMLAVTGLRVEQVRTLEHLIEVRLGSQSGAQASFDMQDFTRVAVSLYEHGQALHAIFHSHRFSGPPHPSGTDDRLQRILEEGGYPAIQAVFSEDGYVRFFAQQRRFTVEVHGKGVESIDRDRFLYRIVHFGALPHPALAPARGGRGECLRSLPARARG